MKAIFRLNRKITRCFGRKSGNIEDESSIKNVNDLLNNNATDDLKRAKSQAFKNLETSYSGKEDVDIMGAYGRFEKLFESELSKNPQLKAEMEAFADKMKSDASPEDLEELVKNIK